MTPGAPAEIVARVDGKEAQTLQLGSEPGGESSEIRRPRFQAELDSQVAELNLLPGPRVAIRECLLARHRGADLGADELTAQHGEYLELPARIGDIRLGS